MLSNIGRAAVRRVGGSTQSTNQAIRYLWHLHRVTPTQNTANPSTQLQSAFNRSYATATTEAAATKAKPAAKTARKTTAKTTAGTKTRAKNAAKKPLKKKPLKKKKAVTKKTKPKPKARKRKPLSETEKAKQELKELKVKALLKTPKLKPTSAWAVFVSEAVVNRSAGTSVKEAFKLASPTYKALAGEELERYNHIANQNKESNEIALKEWVAGFTPEQINAANNARGLLRRKYAAPGTRVLAIKDDRLPKGTVQARQWFVKERHATGDFKGINIIEANTLIMKEWDALSASEKKPYKDAEVADKQRYLKEYKAAFGRESSASV